jgi:hypothetical protein
LRTFRIKVGERADSRDAASGEAHGMNPDTAIFILLEAYAVLTPLVFVALVLRLSIPGPSADEARDS